MEMVLIWFEIFPHYLKAFKETKQYDKMYMIDLPSAISQCGYELTEILGKIWGTCLRARNFFNQYKSEYIHAGDYCRKELIKENGLVMAITNIFGEMNGFKRIIRIIKGN